MDHELERMLARHCAPVLLGKKAAALVSLPHHIGREVSDISALLGGEVYAQILGVRPRHTLVLIYRPALLTQALRRPRARRILAKRGYLAHEGLVSMLTHLAKRIEHEPDFPHEVGLFLGYPARDVEGFIRHKGRHYKYCGDWKVYGNEWRARALFAEFGRCRQQLTAYVEGGGQLSCLYADSAAG